LVDKTSTEKIVELLEKGYRPYEIVKMGYAKSTVYTVYKKWKKKREEILAFVRPFIKKLLDDHECVLYRSKTVICNENGAIKIFYLRATID